MQSIMRVTSRVAVVGAVVVGCLAAGAGSATAAGSARTPATPTKLSANGHTTSAHRAHVTISWHEARSRGLTGVTVYRNTRDSVHGAKRIGHTRHASLQDARIKPGRTYWYFLRATAGKHRHSGYTALPVVVSATSRKRTVAARTVDARGHALHWIQVDIEGSYQDSGFGTGGDTDNSGEFDAHMPANYGVTVCFQSGPDSGGLSPRTGYLGGCYHRGHQFVGGRASKLRLARGQFRSVAVALPAAGGIRGTLTGSDDGDIRVYDSADKVVASQEITLGTPYDFTNLRPGDYWVTGTDRTGQAAPRIWDAADHAGEEWDGDPSDLPSTYAIHVRPTRDYLVNLTLPPYGAITGTVTGAKAGTVTVSLSDDEDGALATSRAAGGSFRFGRLIAKGYTVCATGVPAAGGAQREYCWDGTHHQQVATGSSGPGEYTDDGVPVSYGHTTSGLGFDFSA